MLLKPIEKQFWNSFVNKYVQSGVQVWEVRLWKLDDSNSKKGPLYASSRVTLLTNMAVSEEAKDTVKTYKKYETKQKHARL